ncbi:MAG: FAD-binding oxidoreductase [Woeseiaceae bacterium]|nr:FAD-binding oxidoreductase [Woeseiaceae bacterium]
MAEIVDSLREIVGSTGVLTGDDVAARPAAWLRRDPTRALAIVRPATTDEVSRVMRCCHEAGQVVVPLGGNTGLVDGTLSTDTDVLLSFERMTAIESIDTAGGTMTVEAGVPLTRVHDSAAEHGLVFPVDFGARGSATIGGAISTNAGGNAVIRYGMMREQVLGLEAVLADGTVVSSMNRMLKNNAGFDLKHMFIGTEGTLGIVTRAVLRLRPELASQNTAFVAVDAFTKIPDILRELGTSLGGSLTAFEVLWADFYETVVTNRDRHTPPVPGGYPYYILIEARGGSEAGDSERFEAALGALLEKSLIADAAFAQSVQQRNAMWAIRDDIDGLFEILDPVMAFDVSLPISGAEAYAAGVHERLRERWPETYHGTTFGHLGDSNIHFLLTIGSRDHAEQKEVMKIVYSELEPYGGSISAEHGIGLEKRDFLHHSRDAAEIALMKRLKTALDPDGLLNPGKVIE